MTDPYQPIRLLLKRVRARWRLVRAFEGMIRAALGASLVLAATVGAIRFLPNRPIAFVLVGLLAVLLVAAAVLWGLAPVQDTPSDHHVARFVEERVPSLEDRLASAVDVVASGRGVASPAVIEPMLADAAKRVGAIDVDDIMPRATLGRRGGQAAAALLVLAALLFAGRGFWRQTVDAVSLTLFPSRVTLEVTPGDARVRPGTPLEIRARLVGNQAPVVATLESGDGDRWRAAHMDADGAGRFHLALAPVMSSFKYRVTAGSLGSRTYSVDVARPPRVTRIDIDYTYPSTVGLKPRTEEDSGDIYAPAGTEARLRVHTDRPAVGGQLALGDGKVVALSTIAPAELAAALRIVADGSYRIALTDRDGYANPGDTEYFIRVLEDRRPQVRIVRPASDSSVTPLEEVEIEARVDDDFGIARLELVYAVRGRDEKAIPLAVPRGATTLDSRHTLFLEDLDLHPGDFISYYVRAFDHGHGKSSNEGKSDIFFLEVKPFEQEYVLAQSQAGQGGKMLDDLVTAQKEVVVATWKLDARARAAGGARSDHDIHEVSMTEADLKSRVEEAASSFRENTMRNPRQRPQGRGGPAPKAGQTSGEEDEMTAASAAMGKAVAALDELKTHDALPPEMDALTHLLKAQAALKRREVSRQQAGNGNGDANRNYDLSTLFDKELQRSQQTNYENRTTAERRDDKDADLLARIRELARRQDEVLKQQQALARDREKLSAADLKRELEKLTREQSELRRQAEEIAGQQNGRGAQGGQRMSGQNGERMRDISEEMRDAAGELRRQDPGGASERGSRALNKLRDLERRLQAAGPDDRRRALGDMQLETREVAEAQRRIASELAKIGEGDAGKDAARRMAGDEERLAERVRKLQESLKQEGSVGDAGRQIERQRLAERMQSSADTMRAAAERTGRQGVSADPRGQAEAQREVARALDKVADALASTSGAGDAQSRTLAEQLSKAENLRERLQQTGRELQRLKDQNGRISGDRPGSREAPGAAGRAGEGQQRGGGETDLAKLGSELARQLQQARELMDQLHRDDSRVESGSGVTPEGRGMVLSAPGTETFKQDFATWEQLRVQATQALEAAASSLSARLQARQARDRLPAGVDDKAPPEYRQQVDRYFKAIADGKK